MHTTSEQQRQLIVEQFTKQAVPFAEMPAHNEAESNRLVLEAARIGPADTVLDLACGPGLITCAVAGAARHVTGLDITPAMLEQARRRQADLGLTNVDWQLGDVESLPFDEGTFSCVMTRYSFHHLLSPQAGLREMVRVCQPRGRVVVIDVVTRSPEQQRAYDQVEKWRDPSHVSALQLRELTGLFVDAGLKNLQTAFYKVPVDLEEILAASFPNPGDADRVRARFEQDLGHDQLGVGAQRENGRIRFAFPIAIVVGERADVLWS